MRNGKRRTAHWIRRGVQALFLVLFILMTWNALYYFSSVYPYNLLLRLDPLAAFSAAWTSNIWLYLLPAWILLGLTIVSGRFFCGWLCPLGSFLEWLPSLRKRRKKSSRIRPRDVSGKLIKKGQIRLRFKYFLLAALLLLFVMGINLLWIFDPLAIANRAVVFVLLGSLPFLFITLVVLAVLVGPRFWCMEMCPLGATLSLASMAGARLPAAVSPLSLVKDGDACTNCGACAYACPFEIVEVADSEKKGRLALRDCALCGECVTACPKKDVLSLQVMGARVLTSGRGYDMAVDEMEETVACGS